MNVHGGVRSESDLGVCFNVHNFVSTLSDQHKESDRVFVCNSFLFQRTRMFNFPGRCFEGLILCPHILPFG